MKIKLKVHYSIKNSLANMLWETIEIPEGCRVKDLLKFIGIDSFDSIMVYSKEGILSIEAFLKDGDEIKILPIVTGG